MAGYGERKVKMADNQANWIKAIKYRVRNVYFNLQYSGGGILNVDDGTSYIRHLIESSEPFMVARLGSEESRTLNRYRMHLPYTKRNIHNIMYNAGVFPNNKQTIDSFCEIYSQAISKSDAMLVWGCVGEAANVRKYKKDELVYIQNAVNNILFYDEPWTTSLKGKRVLIIHPFVETMVSQYEKRELLFPGKQTLPEFKSLETIKCIQSNSGEHENIPYESYFDVLEYLKAEIDEKDYDIALVGAGAYGLPLCAYIKQQGKQSIYMASILQILFGIRGKRWDGWSEWTPYFNEYWVYPSENETPKNSGYVEGGSYWK